jgi:hypothetical protein
MKSSRIIAIFAVLAFLLLPGSRAQAALTFSDNISTVAPGVFSNHDLKWTIADSAGLAEGESFALNFPVEFDTSTITASDIEISNNGSNLTLSSSCGAGAKISFSSNMSGALAFSICPGGGGTVAAGHMIEVKIGTSVAGGSHQIKNPTASGGYLLSMTGSSGYSDTDKTQLVMLPGVTTSAYVAGSSGSLRIIGFASPGALVYFMENGSVLGTQIAQSGSAFDQTLSGLDSGIHLFSIYGTDSGSRSTLTITFSINITSGTTTIASGIILPPTVSLANSQVKRPAQLTASGTAKNNSTVQVFISGSGDNQSVNQPTDSKGNWSVNVNPKLHLGNKQTYAMALDGAGGQSALSNVSSYNVLLSADLNTDNLINLTDFSILMYNYGGSPSNVIADINDNGSVDLVDFSVMMYYWTGG